MKDENDLIFFPPIPGLPGPMWQRWYVLGATEHTPFSHMDTGASSSVSGRPMGCLSPWEQKKWGSWVESKEKGQGGAICLCNRVLD